MRKAAPKNFVKFTGKHLCWSLFLLKRGYFEEHLRTTTSGTLPHGKISVKFFHTETDFLLTQEDSFT